MNEQFVEREIADSLRHLVVERNRHALVLGQRGTGKTTLIKTLAADFSRSQHLVAYIRLADVATANRLVGSIVRELLNALNTHYGADQQENAHLSAVRDLGARLIHSPRSDAAEVLGRFFELLGNSLPKNEKIIIFLDGLDESREPGRIALLIEGLVKHEQQGPAVVVTSHPSFETERLQAMGRFASFVLSDFTQAEAERLLTSMGYDSPAVRAEILSVANHNPLLLRLLTSVLQVYGSIPEAQDKPEVLIRHYIDLAIDRVVVGSINPNATRLVLSVIAMFQPISQASIAEKAGMQMDQVGAIVDTASQYGMLVSDSHGNLSVGHVAFCEQLLTTYFGAADIDPRELRFGDEAAERDELLESSFMPPPDLARIVAGEKTIVLGDRGSGKSAIFHALQQLIKRRTIQDPKFDSQDRKAIIVPSQHPADFLQQVTADGAQISSAERFKALWLVFSAVLVAREVQTLDLADDKSHRQYLKEARKILRQIGWAQSIRGEGWLSRWAIKVRSVLPTKVAFSVGPVTVEPNWSQNSRSFKTANPIQVVSFLENTQKILSATQRHLLLVFDQIDEAYKYERNVQESLIQGLLLAESWLSQRKYVRLVALLRTDLFDIYDIQEKNKFVSRMVRLEWTWSELRALMLKRLYSNRSLRHILDVLDRIRLDAQARIEIQQRLAFPSEVEGLPFAEWLYNGLRTGTGRVSPRQIILFLNLTRDSVKSSPRKYPISLFAEIEVAEALTQLSELSYQEVISDFRVATSFVRNCRSGKIMTFDLNEVQPLFNLNEGPIALQIEQLERLGFLERVVVREADDLVSRFRIPLLFTRCWEQA